MTGADYLHAQVFGNHSHRCPSEYCKGDARQCSDQFDCQPGPKLCANCYYIQEHDADQRRAWRQVDQVLQTGVKSIA